MWLRGFPKNHPWSVVTIDLLLTYRDGNAVSFKDHLRLSGGFGWTALEMASCLISRPVPAL
jgi:hypothetical protein